MTRSIQRVGVLSLLGFGPWTGCTIVLDCRNHPATCPEPNPLESCVSGEFWDEGLEESAEMKPGGNCIACHDEGAGMSEVSDVRGPSFLFAGTVYTNVDEPNDCHGLEGVTIQLTDAQGSVLMEATTNRTGNFFAEGEETDLPFPIHARAVASDGARIEMEPTLTSAADLNCMGCHSASNRITAW